MNWLFEVIVSFTEAPPNFAVKFYVIHISCPTAIATVFITMERRLLYVASRSAKSGVNPTRAKNFSRACTYFYLLVL